MAVGGSGATADHGGAGAGPTTSERRFPRRRHVVMALVLVVAAALAAWTVGAARAVNAYREEVGQAGECSSSDVADDLAALEEELGSIPDEGQLALPAEAFRSAFSQERWSFQGPGLRITRDGDLLHRLDADGWEGLRRGTEGIARIDGAAYWVEECPNIRPWLLVAVDPDGVVGCVVQESDAGGLVTSWRLGAEAETCGGGAQYSVRTGLEGELIEWTAGGTTYEVVEPESHSWPPVYRRVPSVLSSRR